MFDKYRLWTSRFADSALSTSKMMSESYAILNSLNSSKNAIVAPFYVMRVVIIENMRIAVSTSNTIARFLSPFRFFLLYERMSKADAPMLTAAISTENIIYLH